MNMIKRVLIIGGYGNFGRFIARRLAAEANIQLIIAGRHIQKAELLCKQLAAHNPAEFALIDIHHQLEANLSKINPDIVIHTSGPYQHQDYHVAQACINQGCHYIDLSDARDFVVGISQLNLAAQAKNVLICSGASSVPCLANAIINHYQPQFEKITGLDYAIATAQRTNTGLATTSAGLSYAGKPLLTLRHGKEEIVYGWQNLRMRKFWGLGLRFLGNCDIPDLALFPERYPTLLNIRFQAGLELKLLHLILWTLSGLVKYRLFPNLQHFAPLMLKISHYFDLFGKDDSGFYMEIEGLDKTGKLTRRTFEILARHGDGLYIPCVPAIILSKKLANKTMNIVGAMPCLDLIRLDEYLAELKNFSIQWRES
ncbi:saccharopine dehydrogenase [Legionella lansingensis]|uniref:Saccharopine dehydrogenase n=3 Tax=Legionella lansingensis TaxID=45067 RepID=A0A0W0VKD6_9GAMM|nr:saccharopine dehydrogenase [Legionella lansingensis]SNV49932.1 saccharopine dehydrogenase [Legionella lansingensis]